MKTEPTYPANEMAALLLITPRRLRQLAKENVIPGPVERGRYDLGSTVGGYIRYLRNLAGGKGAGLAVAKERLTNLQADTVQALLREYDARYVLVDTVRERWEHWALVIRKHILNSAMSQDEKHDCLQNLYNEIVGDLRKRDRALAKEARRTKEGQPNRLKKAHGQTSP